MAAQTTHWSRARPPRVLAFAVDAAVVGIAGLALATGATWLGREVALDATFLRTVGLVLLPWAGGLPGWANTPIDGPFAPS